MWGRGANGMNRFDAMRAQMTMHFPPVKTVRKEEEVKFFDDFFSFFRLIFEVNMEIEIPE